jgi:hypothetical protein
MTSHPTDDAALAENLKEHHSAMVTELDRLSSALLRPIDDPAAGSARTALSEWLATVLMPHAAEEQKTSYRAADQLPAGHPLITAMLMEHVLIGRLVELFESAPHAEAAAAYARALFEVFECHQRVENHIIFPMLVDDPSVSLVQVMSGHAHEHHQ